MENISTTASSRRSSFDLHPKHQPNPKYKRIFTNNPHLSPHKRLKINNHVLDDLTAKTAQAFKSSYLFKDGNQLKDKLFKKIFCEVYGAYRGGENLVDKVSWDLAKSFPNYSDISKTDYYIEEALDANVEVTTYLPKNALISELQAILEKKIWPTRRTA